MFRVRLFLSEVPGFEIDSTPKPQDRRRVDLFADAERPAALLRRAAALETCPVLRWGWSEVGPGRARRDAPVRM